MRVLIFSVVLTHIPVALVQLLELRDVGKSSDICRVTNESKESSGEHRDGCEKLGLRNGGACVVTLVEEVDGFHAGIFLVADLQLVKLAKQINQPLHHLHAVLTEAKESDTDLSITWEICSKQTNVLEV